MTGLTRLGDVLLFVLLLNTMNIATCEVKVTAFIGDDVLLPCVYSEADSRPQTLTVFWRDRNDDVVLDVKLNKQDLSKQNDKFKGRVSADPTRFRTGNFSIVMKNVQPSDSGPYECNILNEEKQIATLAVSGERVVEIVTIPPGPSVGSRAVTPTSFSVVPLLLLLLLSLG